MKVLDDLDKLLAGGPKRPLRIGMIQERDNYSVESPCPPSDSGLTHFPVCEIYGNNWGEDSRKDAALICAAVNNLPKLIEVIRKQDEALSHLLSRSEYMGEMIKLNQRGRYIDALIEVSWQENMADVLRARATRAEVASILEEML